MLDPVVSEALGDLPRLAHGFFTRAGGVSTGVYNSLNCGIGSNDARAAVAENRARVAGHLGTTPDKLLTCHQIHSATAVFVEQSWTPDAQPKADALVTRTPGLALAALSADCAPVLFVDPVAGVIAAAHAGWKGALGGILEATLTVMEQAGARRSQIRAVVGPCIGHANYEVGPEFVASFVNVDARYRSYFANPSPEARAHFDLPRFAVDRLKAAGAGHVSHTGHCTYAHSNRFYSFRRTTHAGEPDYGRQISAIMLA